MSNTKRSNEKRISKEAIILRHMRIEKGLSLNQAAAKVNITGSAIAHIEHGRMDLSRKRIETLIAAYGYTYDDYFELLDRTDPPIRVRDECLSIIRQLDDSRLQAVHAVLVNFVPQGAARHAGSPSKVPTGDRKRGR
ncbi:helix-turn-helix transcriptional regulator [Bdellovibrionota bacterium FG-2]